MVVEKTSRTCHIIDEACPKYRDLTFEVKTLWKLKKVTTTHIVIGALGARQIDWKNTLQQPLNNFQNKYRCSQFTCQAS